MKIFYFVIYLKEEKNKLSKKKLIEKKNNLYEYSSYVIYYNFLVIKICLKIKSLLFPVKELILTINLKKVGDK